MKVKDVMSEHAVCISANASMQAAAQKMKALNLGTLGVDAENHLVGIITDRDIVVRGVSGGCDAAITKVKGVMTPHVTYCFDDQDIEEAAKLMREKKIRRLAVISRQKKLVGIVSLGDLAVESGDEHLAWETLESVSAPVQAGAP